MTDVQSKYINDVKLSENMSTYDDTDKWFDVQYKGVYIGWVGENIEEGGWDSESGITGMTWNGDSFRDSVDHLVEIYLENEEVD